MQMFSIVSTRVGLLLVALSLFHSHCGTSAYTIVHNVIRSSKGSRYVFLSSKVNLPKMLSTFVLVVAFVVNFFIYYGVVDNCYLGNPIILRIMFN
jgi:hypothetical protein